MMKPPIAMPVSPSLHLWKIKALHIKVHSGFTLVDVLVGMVIAMLGIIIIFQVFSVSEGIKRTTTSGGDALQNGAASMFALENSLKQAGYGFFPSGTVWAWAAPADPGVANQVPVTITVGGSPACAAAGAANKSDCLSLMYRQNWDFGPFVPASGVAASGVNVTPPQALSTETISVNNSSQLVSSLNGVISDGIVLMKVEYGRDTDNNGVVDTWDRQAPLVNPLTVLAVRIVLVARSANPEDKDANGNRVTSANCVTTTVAPTWIDSATVPLDLSGQADLLAAGDNWQCYRYKTFENTVVLRNVIWRP